MVDHKARRKVVCVRAHAHMLTHVHVHRGTQVCKNIEFKAITL